MVQQQESFYVVACALLVLPFQIHSAHFGDYKVLISNSGPTKQGEITSFDAEVVLNPEARTSRHVANENIIYEFFWKVPFEPWIKHNKTTHRWNSFRWRWSSNGQKTVSVYVRILVGSLYGGRDSKDERKYHSGYSAHYAQNNTNVKVTAANATNKINATLYAYQDSSGSKTGDGTFHAGLVNLEVKIHKPKDLDKIICDWNFGDGSQLRNSHLTYMSHNFTTVASSTVNVTLRGWSQGQFYVGTASKTLKFTADVSPYLEITSSAGPKLPSGHTHAIAKNSPVKFEVKFKDRFKAITGVSIDWKFGDGALVTNWNNTTIFHTYNKEGNYRLWVTIRVHTKYQGKKSFDPIVKYLYVKAPVSLAVRHKHAAKDKMVTFDISCNGSLPVSFHWCVSKQCNLPPGKMCSPMMDHRNSCSLIVNHTFRDSGKYCVNVGVRNDVSGTNTSLMVQIPGDIPRPKHSTGKNTAGVLVPVIIVCFLLIFIVVVVRKWVYSRREKTEKADFDFRDEDTSSLSSVDLYGKSSCFRKCGIWGSCKSQESVPLRIQAADYKLYSL
ncbi:hypothetical protein ACROYT_G037966 [Oculina patagonica]